MNLDPAQYAQIPRTNEFHGGMAKLCDIHPVTYGNKNRIKTFLTLVVHYCTVSPITWDTVQLMLVVH